MKLLNILKITFVAVLFSALYSCDVIDKPYEENGGTDPIDTSSTQNIRKILLEDYTGYKCPNCPGATPVIESLKEIYGDRLVVMAVHAGWFAEPEPSSGHFIYDFRNAAGEAWYTEFGLQFNPTGMVNRKGKLDETHLFALSAWVEQVTLAAEDNSPEMLVNITPKFTEGDAKIYATVNVEFLQDLSKRYKLSVVLVQDGIIEIQNNKGENIENYEHNHVLRGAFNSPWGEVINSVDVSKGEKFASEVSIAIKNDTTHPWDADKLKIIAFVYDADTYEVMQVEEVPVK